MLEAPTVLVVDDDSEIAELACEILSTAGTQAIFRTSVTDATAALALHAGTLRALVTDVMLGSPMSGIELATLASQEWPTLTICVMSGMVHDRPRRLPDGATFLLKPWRPDELIAVVNGRATA